MERVLAEDKALSRQIGQEVGVVDVAWDQSGFVGRYVTGLRRIDLSGCPPEFQDAFRDHIQAWVEYESVARRYGGLNGFIKGFLTAGLAAMDAYSESDSAQERITSTYNEVLRIAGEYNAKVPE